MFTAIKTPVVVCIVMQRCGLIGGLQHFRQTYCPHCSPVMGGSVFSETLAPTCQKTTHHNNPEAHSIDSIFFLLSSLYICITTAQVVPRLPCLKCLDHTQLDIHTQ